jgi:hypothetical protein
MYPFAGGAERTGLFHSQPFEATWSALFSYSVKYSSLFLITQSNLRIQIWETRCSSLKVMELNSCAGTLTGESESVHFWFCNTVFARPKSQRHMGWNQANRTEEPVFQSLLFAAFPFFPQRYALPNCPCELSSPSRPDIHRRDWILS